MRKDKTHIFTRDLFVTIEPFGEGKQGFFILQNQIIGIDIISDQHFFAQFFVFNAFDIGIDHVAFFIKAKIAVMRTLSSDGFKIVLVWVIC